ncbi:SpoIID/LytB domain-containing protein [Nocardia sp. CA-128927]|uniref:SpoIID/LytB domain-containing protein n=1 Tax=Nocardia sp. CA-128927 TaxID=3239975 RepID=UPI003D97B8B8
MLVVGGVTLSVGAVLVLWAWPGETPYRTVAGPGHGRGMSQLGAFANAQEGWTAERILGHYYPGATLGTVPANAVGIRLTAQDDSTLDTFAGAGLRVAGQLVEAGQAAHLTPLPTGGANVVVTVGCDGEVLWQAATDDPWVYPIDPGPNRPAAEHLTLCGGSGYRGALGVATENGQARTVNRVDVEDYLLGVIPAEVQANWADKGGAEALRAQAIAARSYVLAEHRYSYAQSCDTTDCQAYPGTAKEDPRAVAAVAASAGTVLLRDGRILRSEYSSAPGGGEPADIYTFEVGPALTDLAPNAPSVPLDPRKQAAVGESPIDVEYRRIGGPASKVGQPLGPEMALPENAGTYRMFTNGVIISTATLGAQVVDFTTLLQLVPDPAARGGGTSSASVPSAPGSTPSGAAVPPLPELPLSSASAPPAAQPAPPAAGVPPVPDPVPSSANVPPVHEAAPSSDGVPPVSESAPSGASAPPVHETAPSSDGVPSAPEFAPPSAGAQPVPASAPSGASVPPISQSVPSSASVPAVLESAPPDATEVPVPEAVSPEARVLPAHEPVLFDTSAQPVPSGASVPSVREPAPSSVVVVPVSVAVPSSDSVRAVGESAQSGAGGRPVSAVLPSGAGVESEPAPSGAIASPVSKLVPSVADTSSESESVPSDPGVPSASASDPSVADAPSTSESVPAGASEPVVPELAPSGVSAVPEPAPSSVGVVPVPEAVPSAVSVPPAFQSAPSGVMVPPAPSAAPGSTVAPTTAATPTPRPMPIPSGGATSVPFSPGSSEPGTARR